MNWETYKTLTDDQKEEYIFNFKERQPTFNVKGITTWVIILFGSLQGLVFTMYMLLNSPEQTPAIKETISSLSVVVFRTASFLSIIIVVAVIYESVNFIVFEIKQYMWRKKNNIKIIKGWPFTKWNKIK